MSKTEKAIQRHQQKIRAKYMQSARDQARCEDVIHDILADYPEDGPKNLKMINDYRELISREAFQEFEDIAINQINDQLLP